MNGKKNSPHSIRLMSLLVFIFIATKEMKNVNSKGFDRNAGMCSPFVCLSHPEKKKVQRVISRASLQAVDMRKDPLDECFLGAITPAQRPIDSRFVYENSVTISGCCCCCLSINIDTTTAVGDEFLYFSGPDIKSPIYMENFLYFFGARRNFICVASVL